MEDRAVIVPDLLELMNVSSPRAPASLSFYAVFDGHEGQAASQHAADSLHIAFAQSLAKGFTSEAKPSRGWWPWSGAPEAAPTRQLVRQALHEAFRQVDSQLLARAAEENLSDGSTAVVAVLWADLGQEPEVVVAHAGDSKALLCLPHKPQLGKPSDRTAFVSLEITKDHSLARDEERERVEAKGGRVVSDGRILRLNGELAVSRSLGDLPYREFGLIGDPEVSDVSSDMLLEPMALLLLASDGVFETLLPQEACAAAGTTAYPSFGPSFEWTSQPSEAIALGPGPNGQVTGPSASHSAAPSEVPPQPAAAPSGEDETSMSAIRVGRHHWGLLGCHDCGPGTVLAAASSTEPTGGLMSSLHDPTMSATAAAVVREAFNRRSTDNLAAVVVRIANSSRRVKDRHGGGCEMSPCDIGQDGLAVEAVAPKSVTSPASRHQYQLQQLMTLVPTTASRSSIVRHVSWDGKAVPTGTTPRQGICEGFDCLMLWDIHGGLDAHRYEEQMACESAPGHLMELPESASVLLARVASLPMDGGTGNTHQRLPDGTDDRTALLPRLRATSGASDDPAIGESNADGHGQLGWIHAEYAEYKLQGAFAQGAFGEVWRCSRHGSAARESSAGSSHHQHQSYSAIDDASYVLKRLMVEKGSHTRLSGERERYFGELLNREAASFPSTAGTARSTTDADDENNDGLTELLWEGRQHIVRYVESFETNQGRELWLVFRDEGKSLHGLMYEVAPEEEDDGDSNTETSSDSSDEPGEHLLQVLQPSRWWREMRTSPLGDQLVVDIIRQVLLALAAVHHSNITHRDVKPANILVSLDEGLNTPHVRVIDFGSAVDKTSTFSLYGKLGPSELEQTAEYSPPETTFGRFWSGRPAVTKTWPYDIWSAGVVWLELLLGTPHVFQISSRTRATMDHKLNLRRSRTAEERQQLYLLRGLMELCIYPPPSVPKHQQPLPPVPWSCSDQAVLELLQRRDPTGHGPSSVLAVRLLRSLLDWRPSSRPSAREALRHAVFLAKDPEIIGATDSSTLAECSRRSRSDVGWC